MTSVSGAWAAQAMIPYADPQHGVLPVTDPDHRRKDNAVQNPDWDAPSYAVGNGAVSADPLAPSCIGLEAFDLPMAVPVMDQTLEGHSVSESHMADHGASFKEQYAPSSYSFFNERYYGVKLEGDGPTPLAKRAGLPYGRGINSAPINNPGLASYIGEGYRRGCYYGSNVNRDFTPPRRQHDYRFVRPDVVTIIGDAPPPVKPDQYSSPFSSLQRFRSTIQSRPMQRRQPPPFDEDLLYDGSTNVVQMPVDNGGW